MGSEESLVATASVFSITTGDEAGVKHAKPKTIILPLTYSTNDSDSLQSLTRRFGSEKRAWVATSWICENKRSRSFNQTKHYANAAHTTNSP